MRPCSFLPDICRKEGMTPNLARYHGRYPRYILQTEDDYLVRVAGPQQTPWEEGTEIKNVSLTGLAFTAPADLCPILGEVIKIQFTPPGARQLASYAIVIRLDQESGDRYLVAVHFYKMEMPHRIALAQGLARKLREVQIREEGTDPLISPMSFGYVLPSFFMLGFLMLMWLESFFLFTRFGYEGLFNLLKAAIGL
jgi:hypothetical protein